MQGCYLYVEHPLGTAFGTPCELRSGKLFNEILLNLGLNMEELFEHEQTRVRRQWARPSGRSLLGLHALSLPCRGYGVGYSVGIFKQASVAFGR